MCSIGVQVAVAVGEVASAVGLVEVEEVVDNQRLSVVVQQPQRLQQKHKQRYPIAYQVPLGQCAK